MNRGAQIKGLLATPTAVTVGELLLHLLQDALVRADGLSHDELTSVFQCLRDFLTAGHFAHASATVAVRQDQQVTGEKRAVRPA